MQYKRCLKLIGMTMDLCRVKDHRRLPHHIVATAL